MWFLNYEVRGDRHTAEDIVPITSLRLTQHSSNGVTADEWGKLGDIKEGLGLEPFHSNWSGVIIHEADSYKEPSKWKV